MSTWLHFLMKQHIQPQHYQSGQFVSRGAFSENAHKSPTLNLQSNFNKTISHTRLISFKKKINRSSYTRYLNYCTYFNPKRSTRSVSRLVLISLWRRYLPSQPHAHTLKIKGAYSFYLGVWWNCAQRPHSIMKNTL